jgi:hypothetical protein
MVSRSRRQLASGSAHRQPETYQVTPGILERRRATEPSMVSRSRRQLASGSAHRQPETYRHDRTPPPGRLILTPRLTWTTRPVPLIGWVWRLRRDLRGQARNATQTLRVGLSEPQHGAPEGGRRRPSNSPRSLQMARTQGARHGRLRRAQSPRTHDPRPSQSRSTPWSTPSKHPRKPLTPEVAGSSPVVPTSIESAVSRRQQELGVERSPGCTTRSEATG